MQKKKRILCLALALALVLALPALAATDQELNAAVEKSAAYMLETVKNPQVGSIGGEWAVIGLARSGYAVPQAYWDDYYAAVEQYVKDCGGVLHDKKYTEYSRVSLALTAIGADPTDVAGYNLLTPLGDFDKTVWQGVNGPIWALIALDSGDYDMPVNAQAETQATRQMYVDEILRRQLSDGGWNLTADSGSGTADPDLTGMAIQALAGYRDQAAVKSAVEKALSCLSAMQNAQGSFDSWGTSNSESSAQVLVALCTLGISPDDARFVKNGNTVLDGLLSYRQADGSFRHTAGGSGSNQMASEQGFYALVAAQRAAAGKSGLYQMDDVTIHVTDGSGTVGLPGKHQDVQRVPVVSPGKTFDDIAQHKNQGAIEALAARSIIDGMGDGTFAPDNTMTRAQFAAIVVRGLGLSPKATNDFTDLNPGAWYLGYIGTASTYGIVNGRGDGTFDPEGKITRQEAAAMVARAAKLCGMDTALSETAVRDILAQFGDYVTVADWARESVAFCYREGILDQSDLNVEPERAIRRGELAQMLYNMLGSAKLL